MTIHVNALHFGYYASLASMKVMTNKREISDYVVEIEDQLIILFYEKSFNYNSV